MAETGPILVSIEDFREVQNMLHVLRSALETSESELTEAKEANQRLEAAVRRCLDICASAKKNHDGFHRCGMCVERGRE